jgi:hypothetical protein
MVTWEPRTAPAGLADERDCGAARAAAPDFCTDQSYGDLSSFCTIWSNRGYRRLMRAEPKTHRGRETRDPTVERGADRADGAGQSRLGQPADPGRAARPWAPGQGVHGAAPEAAADPTSAAAGRMPARGAGGAARTQVSTATAMTANAAAARAAAAGPRRSAGSQRRSPDSRARTASGGAAAPHVTFDLAAGEADDAGQVPNGTQQRAGPGAEGQQHRSAALRQVRPAARM